MNNFKLLPCPFCGHNPDMENLIDSLHRTGIYSHYIDNNDLEEGVHYTHNPEGALSEGWKFTCLTTEGGCGAQVHGEGKQDTINNWNRREWPIP